MAGFDNEVLFAENVDYSGGSPVTGKITAAGQLSIGTGASPAIATGSITSTGGSVTITYSSPNINIETGSAIATTYDSDAGTATPSSGNLDVLGGTLINTAGATNVITINADDTVVASVVSDSGTATPASNAFSIVGTGGITTSAATSVITITDLGAQVISLTALDNTDSPYTVLSTDYYMTCDVSSGVLTIELPNGPTTGRTFIVKDAGGDSATNNITITTVGGVVTIDGGTTFVMNTDYESVSLVFNGTSYEVF